MLAPPTAALADDLASGRVAALVRELSTRLGVPQASLPVLPLAALQPSYVALFVAGAGGAPAPPYASLVTDATVMGPRSAAVAEELADLGLAPAPAWRDLHDHVAALAEAGALLVLDDRSEAAAGLARRHLVPWLDRFAPVVADRDPDGLYGPAVAWLRAALEVVVG